MSLQSNSVFLVARRLRPRRVLLGSACAFAIAAAIGIGAPPATAKPRLQAGHDRAEHPTSKQPFGNIPQGPLQAFISLNNEELHLYSGGTLIASAPVSTGVPEHPTPLGVFDVIQRDRFHVSNIYSDAPMPFMQRITWSGVALHEGEGVGHPHSHGCIRMPHQFAARLWMLPTLGMRVVISRSALKPLDFADPHLFVHKAAQPTPMASMPSPLPVKTAQSVDGTKIMDVAAASSLLSSTDPAAGIAGVGTLADPPPTAAATATPAADPATVAASDMLRGTEATQWVPLIAPESTVPMPAAKPPALAATVVASHRPIAIFISRKAMRIYVRQHFEPLFDAPITIADPQQPLGTHVFTAMDYLSDGATFRWNVVSLPGEQIKVVRVAERDRRSDRYGRSSRSERREQVVEPAPPPQSPQQALARVEIPQDVIDRISELMVPGSSLIVSDHGLGQETGTGTDFIVVTR